jgi:orotate phosphoribosyltransferase
VIKEGNNDNQFLIVRNRSNRNKQKDAGDLQLFSYIRRVCKQKGMFTLASGLVSTQYFDMKLATCNPEMLTRIYYSFENILKQRKDKIGVIGSVGGLETGAIPLITYMSKELMIPSFYIRKQAKETGTLKAIEGIVRFPVLLLEDVTSTGRSFEYVKWVLENEFGKFDTKICAKLVVIDRRSDIYDFDYGEIISLFRESDFG